MLDELYIKSLLLKSIGDDVVDQLLKIYTYTKDYDFALKYRKYMDVDTLKKIVECVKEECFDKEYFEILKNAQKHKLNIVPYLTEKFDKDVLRVLIEAEIKGINVDKLKNAKFQEPEVSFIISWMEKGIKNIECCMDPKYSIFDLAKIIQVLKDYDIALQDFINVSIFTGKQCIAIGKVLSEYGQENELLDYNVLFSPKLEPEQIIKIASLMENELPYDILFEKKYPERIYDLAIRAIARGSDEELIRDMLSKDFKERQILTVIYAIGNENFDINRYDYSKIFDPKHNYHKIAIYNQLAQNYETEFLNKIIDKDYSVEQITDLFFLYKEDIDIDALINVDDIKALHLCKRKAELTPLDKSPKDYTINPVEKEAPKQKFSIKANYKQNQFFLTEDNCILEVETDPICRPTFGHITETEPDVRDKIAKFKDTIIEVLKNRFVIMANEDAETLGLYDLVEDKIVLENIDGLGGSRVEPILRDIFINYAMDNDWLYEDLYVAILNTRISGEFYPDYDPMDYRHIIDFSLESPLSIEDIIEYVPGFRDEVKISMIDDTWLDFKYYIVTDDDIIKKYGKINEETSALAYAEFKKIAEILNVDNDIIPYKCTKYNLKSKKMEEISGYYGETIFDDIEKDFGKIIKNLGLQEDISSAITYYKNQMEESR